MSWEWFCPAKVNLFLAVGKKDAVGYHPIRSVFQAIGLFDDLGSLLREYSSLKGPSVFDAARGTVVHACGPHLIECNWADFPQESTVSKALRLAAEIAIFPPLHVTLTKRIPVQSGLGGGSSNAAGILRLLQFIGVSMSDHEVSEVARAVGADVPFFLMNGRAKAEGYGELLTQMPDPPAQWYVVAKPEIGCATGAMYAALDELDYPWRDFPEGDELYNDFERVAPCESLDLIETLQTLGAMDAGLSGSGSAVFGRFLAKERAETAKDYLVERLSCQAWVAKTLDAGRIPV